MTLNTLNGQVPEWLRQVDNYRRADHLSVVGESAALDHDVALHNRYESKTGDFGHVESPSSPYYTTAGAQAGLSSDLYEGISADLAVPGWMGAPFHALGILNPDLHVVGFSNNGLFSGLYLSSSDTNETANPWPVLWPGAASKVDLATYSGEDPDATAACPKAWGSGAGLPIIVMFGQGNASATSASATLVDNGRRIRTCVVTATNYHSSVSAPGGLTGSPTEVGRSLLAYYDAVFVIPEHPLSPGTRCTVDLVVGTNSASWSFRIDYHVLSGL